MKKFDVVREIVGNALYQMPRNASAKAFAPTNIALCKYWGKRNQELNLPVTSSLSISLGKKGTTTEIIVTNNPHDLVFLNNYPVDLTTSFGKRLISFLDLFRANGVPHFIINTESNIPIAAGLASSASGFASIVNALNHLFGWNLQEFELSILARLGSGSACRSIWQGFVEWRVGVLDDGMDSYGQKIPETWPQLCIGLLVLSEHEKALSSREAMQRTVMTSPLYAEWPRKVTHDMHVLKEALSVRDFELLGKTAESNAMSMHATMLAAWPPITYLLPDSLVAMRKVWELRQQGLQLYFTQDAGPNLKLLFLEQDAETVAIHFPSIEVLQPFNAL